MIKKHILNTQRIRSIDGGFTFIPHRFLTDGFVAALDPQQLLLYFFFGDCRRQERTFLLQLRFDLQPLADAHGSISSGPKCFDRKRSDRL